MESTSVTARDPPGAEQLLKQERMNVLDPSSGSALTFAMKSRHAPS